MIECPENEKGSMLGVFMICVAVMVLGILMTVIEFKDLFQRQVAAQEKIAERCQNGLPNSVPR